MSLHPIADKAEVSVDFPDKAYIGSFSRHSQFDATPTATASPSGSYDRARIGERRWFTFIMVCWRRSLPNSHGP